MARTTDFEGQLPREFAAYGRRIAGTDDGNGTFGQQAGVTLDAEERRAIVDLPQQGADSPVR